MEQQYFFTIKEWAEASKLADKWMKDDLGHRFETILKTRCVYCRRKPGIKTKCMGWFMTLHNNLLFILMNKKQYLNPSTLSEGR